MYEHLTQEERDGILVVRMHRPRSRNALSLALMQELTELAHGCETRDAVRAIVLAGGPDHFSAGADLKDPGRWDATSKPLREQRRIANAGYRMCAAWEAITQAEIETIAANHKPGRLQLGLVTIEGNEWRADMEEAAHWPAWTPSSTWWSTRIGGSPVCSSETSWRRIGREWHARGT